MSIASGVESRDVTFLEDKYPSSKEQKMDVELYGIPSSVEGNESTCLVVDQSTSELLEVNGSVPFSNNELLRSA